MLWTNENANLNSQVQAGNGNGTVSVTDDAHRIMTARYPHIGLRTADLTLRQPTSGKP